MIAATTTASEDSHPAQRIGTRWVEVLLIVMVFFALAGDPAPRVNEAHYLARMKHFWDPSWCAGDLFLESSDAHGLFVWAFGWVTRWLSLTATAWVGCVAAWTLLAWAWQRLSWRVVPVPLVSVLGAAIWAGLTEKAHLAGEWVVGGVEAKCFAYVLVLIAIRAMVDRKWNRVCLALGLASAFHVLVGGWSVIVCGGIWAVEQFRSDRLSSAVHDLFAMLPGLIVGGLLALLGLVPALTLNMDASPEVAAEANRIYVFERLPHHLALLTMSPEDVVVRIVRHVALILCLWALARTNRRSENVDQQSQEALRVVTWYAWGAVALAVIGFAIELALWTRPDLAASLLRYYWFRLTDVAVPLALALQALVWIVVGFRRQQGWAVWALAAVIAVAGYPIALATAARWEHPFPPADASMADPAAWADACQWIDENTPRDAVFLTPRLSASFKWRTGRAEVATRKDVPQDARHMVEWFQRLRDIYYYQIGAHDEPFNSVGQLGTERAVEMARKYGADFIVSDQDHPLALRPVYPTRDHPNDEYVVYAVPDRNED
jgi:hypothetical protein